MSICVTNIGSIPKSGFDWYITFVELDFEPKIQKEINSHFHEFGKSIGTKALAIRGYDAKNFRDSVFEASALYDEINTTSLIVTNKNPEVAFSSKNELVSSKILVFPLMETFKKHGSILPLLRDLSKSLVSGNAIESLENLKIDEDTGKLLDENFFIQAWDWLCNYSEMKPGLFGFNLDFKLLVNTYILKR